MIERSGLLTLEQECVAQVVVSPGEVGFQPDGSAQVADRGVEVPTRQERQPEVVVILGPVGLEPARGPAAVDGAVDLSECPARLGETGVVLRLGGPDCDRLAEERRGPTRIASPEGHQAQEMEGIRLDRDRPPGPPRRPGQPARSHPADRIPRPRSG